MKEKLEEIKIENFIIFIYYILLTIYLYANTIETQYLKYQNKKDKEKYRILLYIVFGSAFLIALYYTISDIENLNKNTNQATIQLQKLSTSANILILIASIIYLYIIYKDENINLEISP